MRNRRTRYSGSTIVRAIVQATVRTALLAALLAAGPVAQAGAAGAEQSCEIQGNIGNDLGDLITAPGEWTTEEWVAAGVVGATTTGLVAWWDQDIVRVAADSPESFPYVVVHKIAWLGKWYGKNDINPIITFAAVTGGLYAAGELNDDDYLVRTTGIMAESYLFTAGFTFALKLLFGRSRPAVGDGPHRWHLVGLHGRDTRSFPSGHASSAFSMATVLARRHSDWWVQVPAYTLATGFSAQRIDSGAHWASDVLVGAVLGYAISAFLADRHTCDDPAGVAAPVPYISFALDF